jgi:hypothetical protein
MIVEVTILVHFRVFVLAFVAGCVWVQLNYAQNSIIKANFSFFFSFFVGLSPETQPPPLKQTHLASIF